MRKALIAAAIAVLLVAGAVGGYVLEKRHEARNIVGSPSVEFVTTKPKPPPRRKRIREAQTIVWPEFGYDPERTKAPAYFRQRPPFRPVWTFRAPSLLEFPPVLAYGRGYITSLRGGLFALDVRTG